MNKYRKMLTILVVCILCVGCNVATTNSKESAVFEINKNQPLEKETETMHTKETTNSEAEILESNVKNSEEPSYDITNRDIEFINFKSIEECGELVFSSKEGEKVMYLNMEIDQDPTEIRFFVESKEADTIHIFYKESHYTTQSANEVYFLDMDETDMYQELAIMGWGIGGNPFTEILRVTEREIVPILRILDLIKIDNLGRLFKYNDVITFSPKPIIGIIYAINEDQLYQDSKFSEGFEFTLKEEVCISFLPELKDETSEDIEIIRVFDVGTKFVIYKYDRDGNWYAEVDDVRGYINLRIAG